MPTLRMVDALNATEPLSCRQATSNWRHAGTARGSGTVWRSRCCDTANRDLAVDASTTEFEPACAIRRNDGVLVDYCIGPEVNDSALANNELHLCTHDQLLAERLYQPQTVMPLTNGRELIDNTRWNIWTTVTGLHIDGERFGRDVETVTGTAAFGADRQLNADVIAGFSITLDSTHTDAYRSAIEIDTRGFEVGAYMAVRLNPHWALDGSLSYGFSNSQSSVVVLDGDYDTHQFGPTVSLHGQYAFQEFQIRPKATLSFNRVFTDGYNLSGTILGQPINIPMSSNSASLGALEFTTEISRLFSFDDGQIVQPYVEAGAVYEYVRPNGGEILDDDLHAVTPSAWSFSLRAGATAMLAENVSLDARIGYLSLGQKNLDSWEGQMRLSVSF